MPTERPDTFEIIRQTNDVIERSYELIARTKELLKKSRQDLGPKEDRLVDSDET